MDTLQPTAPKGTEDIESKYSNNIDDKYSSQRGSLIDSTKSAYSKISKNTTPQETKIEFLANNAESYNPLYAVRQFDGTISNHSLNDALGSWFDDAWNPAKQLANAIERAEEALINKLKDAINSLLKSLDDIVNFTEKALSNVIGAIGSFCTSVVKGVVSFVNLIIEVLKGIFDFSMAFDIGVNFRELLLKHFGDEESGFFSHLKNDLEEGKVMDFYHDHKSQASQASQETSKISELPKKAEDDTQSTKKLEHKNHTKNQISQHVDLSSVGSPNFAATNANSRCKDISDDVKKLGKDIEDLVSNIVSDVSKGNISGVGSDLTKATKAIGSDVVNLSEDVLKCAIELVLESFTEAINTLLMAELPELVQKILNFVIVPLFGLGERRFKYSSDILFFIAGFVINIFSVIGSAFVNLLAPSLDINVSEFLASRGEHVGEMDAIFASYKGVNNMSDIKPSESLKLAVLLAKLFVDMYSIPMLQILPTRESEEGESEFDTFAKKFKMATLLLGLATVVAKEIFYATTDTKQKEVKMGLVGFRAVIMIYGAVPLEDEFSQKVEVITVNTALDLIVMVALNKGSLESIVIFTIKLVANFYKFVLVIMGKQTPQQKLFSIVLLEALSLATTIVPIIWEATNTEPAFNDRVTTLKQIELQDTTTI